ncbi:MAG: thioredoxin [Puniceicoccales bacterium]|jgi:thioredoxin 1|nr:thioredoxin [Puniceicoccales bacterium]
MKELDGTNFDDALRQSPIVVVDFWAPWCGPCRAMSPVIEQVADEIGQLALVAKINIDDAPDLAERFDVMSIPTVIFFKQGNEVKRTSGMATKADIVATINSL